MIATCIFSNKSQHIPYALQALLCWLLIPELPVNHRVRAHSDKNGKFPDQKVLIHPCLADGLPHCLWLFRIRGIKLDEMEASCEGIEGLRKVVFL